MLVDFIAAKLRISARRAILGLLIVAILVFLAHLILLRLSLIVVRRWPHRFEVIHWLIMEPDSDSTLPQIGTLSAFCPKRLAACGAYSQEILLFVIYF